MPQFCRLHFLRDFGNQTFGLVFRNDVLVPDVPKPVSEDLDWGIDVSLHHVSMNGVSAGGLPILCCFKVTLDICFSWRVGVNIKCVVSAGVQVTGCSGYGQFNTSWKCCTHLAAYLLSVKRLLPSLFFTGADCPVFLSQFDWFCVQHPFRLLQLPILLCWLAYLGMQWLVGKRNQHITSCVALLTSCKSLFLALINNNY